MPRCLLAAFLLAGTISAQDLGDVAHPECTFFGPQREHFLPREGSHRNQAAELTAQVTRLLATPAAMMASPPGGSRTFGSGGSNSASNLIDVFLWKTFKANGATPAAPTNDYEFIRRVTLDLTGRVPVADRVIAFVADTNPNKRAALVDELLASPQWIDKWTMFYGDLFKSAANWPSTGTAIGVAGRDAFNNWIRASLAQGVPYNVMAKQLIGSAGNNNFNQGELNWIINGRVTGTNIPAQDTYDAMTANVADTFLGIAHLNCLLCHNGRGHLDTLNLWAAGTTRMQAWGTSAFLAHISLQNPLSDPTNTSSPRLWYPVDNNTSKNDYLLNTTTGNRPPRQPVGSTKMIPPAYVFTGEGPKSGEGYRQALARIVTSDMQFARAAVNYVWAAFFGVGIVDPPDQFDPARLDPNNPPPSPWTLQPSNPELLNALAEDFAANNYDLKRLMRLIANSNAYQLESQYDPAKWNPNWAPLFARHNVRRLWGEEVQDSLALSSNVPVTFNVALAGGVTPLNWAMKYPEPSAEGSVFLKAFLPGNRDDQPRRPDGATQQALVLMNDGIVMNRLIATPASNPSPSLLTKALAQSDVNSLIGALYINILSRYPTDAEKQAAATLIGSAAGTTKTQKVQELMWTLYNKVDFLFNY
ncbi:MAG: DUF1549 and DUF1553 domain-containing protein [Acidobacteriia bacterium]|nr:DUF1549 and DUF1553 domain-containing protein [Terriglobia bacterium]